MNVTRRLVTLTVVAGAFALGLSGCSVIDEIMGQGTEPCGDAFAMCSQPWTPTPTQPSAPPSEEACTGISADEALEIALEEMPPPFEDESMSDVVWSPDNADLDGYTECAPLSYLIVPIEQGTGSSPVQVVFFHGDDYAGTATEPSMGFWPAVEQLDEDTVAVTWRYPEEGDSNANPSGESTSVFNWNDESGEVERDGDLPPYATEL